MLIFLHRTNLLLGLKPDRFNYYINSKHVAVPNVKSGTNDFIYSYLALGWIDFIIIILLLYTFKICKLGIQIRKMML